MHLCLCVCVCVWNKWTALHCSHLASSCTKCRFELPFASISNIKKNKISKYEEHKKCNGIDYHLKKQKIKPAEPKENHLPPFQRCTYKFLPLTTMSVEAWRVLFVIEKPAKGTLSARSVVREFQFHTLYKAEVKALSTSIIKAIYTKKTNQKQKKLYLQKHNSLWFSVIFVCFTFWDSSNHQQVIITQHCNGGRLVQLLTTTDLSSSVMWERFTRHLCGGGRPVPHCEERAGS